MSITMLVFILVVLGMLIHVVTAIASRQELSRTTRIVVCALVVAGALVVPGVLAARGSLDRYSPLPAPPLVQVATVAAATVVLVFSPVGAALSRISLVWLVGFQSFRIPVEWWLHRLYVEGVVPVQMTYAGRNFDIVTGFTALAVGLWLAVGRPPRAVVLLWNIAGLLLLVNIVTIAVLSTPAPFRSFLNEPANRLPSMFPHVWLPTFLVQAALAGHLLVFRALARGARS